MKNLECYPDLLGFDEYLFCLKNDVLVTLAEVEGGYLVDFYDCEAETHPRRFFGVSLQECLYRFTHFCEIASVLQEDTR